MNIGREDHAPQQEPALAGAGCSCTKCMATQFRRLRTRDLRLVDPATGDAVAFDGGENEKRKAPEGAVIMPLADERTGPDDHVAIAVERHPLRDMSSHVTPEGWVP